MSSTKPNHPYHLVDPSPWPIIGSVAALVLAVGALMFMHEINGGSLVLGVGSLMTLAVMVVWWRDVINEGEHLGHHTSIVQLGLRYGMVLFIAAIYSLEFFVFLNIAMAATLVYYPYVRFQYGQSQIPWVHIGFYISALLFFVMLVLCSNSA